MDYQFTQNWFGHARPGWDQLIPFLPDRKRFLEVGSFEGRSMVYTVENLLEDGGELICVDTWLGSAEHQSKDMSLVEQRFNHNQSILFDKYPNRTVTKIKGPSYKALQNHLPGFDMIYIDGSHHGLDVMTDACLAWPLMKRGGVMVFDDYGWEPQLPAAQNPKLAIDTFLIFLEDKCEIIQKDYQVIIRKR